MKVEIPPPLFTIDITSYHLQGFGGPFDDPEYMTGRIVFNPGAISQTPDTSFDGDPVEPLYMPYDDCVLYEIREDLASQQARLAAQQAEARWKDPLPWNHFVVAVAEQHLREACAEKLLTVLKGLFA